MIRFRPVLLCVLATASIAAARTVRDTWHDAARDRDVPVLIYLPDQTTPQPTVIFSHGLGGSRDGYSYLGTYWSAHGYVSVHLQHLGSDTAAAQGSGDRLANLRAASTDPKNATDRCLDVSFAIDQLTKLDHDSNSPLHDRIDPAHLGMAGHSFGAHTTMAIAGQLSLRGVSHADPRIVAAIAMSPPSPAGHSTAAMLEPVRIPVFDLTGTADDSPIGETKAADRRYTFDHLVHAPAYLAIFDGGDHMLFSGRRPLNRHVATDDRYHALIQQTTTLFWDAYLRGDAKAKDSFNNGGVRDLLSKSATFELKPGDSSIPNLH